MSNFQYTVDNLKDCILDTERNLRDLLSTLLINRYGPLWESSPKGWSKEERDALTSRQHDEQNKIPNQHLSTRLLDYAHILDLKKLIERNLDIFSRVFQSKATTSAMLETLSVLRNPSMHGRAVLLPHQQYLALGICGEFLLAVETWRSGYKHRVESYGCLLSFSVYEKIDGAESAERAAKDKAITWIKCLPEKIKGLSSNERVSGEQQEGWLIRLPSGHVAASLTGKYRGYDGSYFQSTSIELRSQSHDAIASLLDLDLHPYWLFKWTLADDLDLDIVASRAKERAGKRPSSSVQMGLGSGVAVLDNVDFGIGNYEAASVRVHLERASSNRASSISITCDAKANIGFHHAHRIFSVE